MVAFLVDDKRGARVTRWVYANLSDLSVRLEGTPLHGPVVALRDSVRGRLTSKEVAGLPHWVVPVPQSALRRAIRHFAPDVVVVNSVERWAWRLIHAVCRGKGIPTILYVREEDSLGHVRVDAKPDVLVANTASLAEVLRGRGMTDCAFVPSVIDPQVTLTESSRRVVLAINPIPAKGVDIVWAVARHLPDIPFVVQESWPLTGADLELVLSAVGDLPNVEFRRAVPPGPGLYADARLLLVPYRVDSRPRVIQEAHSNGIPVVAADVPALADAVATGGLVVPLDDEQAWVAAVRRLWDDEVEYDELAQQARVCSRRPEVDPDRVTSRFEMLMADAVGARAE